MNIIIASIGKLKSGPEAVLYEHYLKRLPWKVTAREFELKKNLQPEQRKQQEAELLLGACKDATHIIAMDEEGKELSSVALAGHIERRQDEGDRNIAFVIGGADGLHNNIRQKAHLLLSFGRITWPHLLVRGLLAEQLYRSYTIITKHPYHRE